MHCQWNVLCLVCLNNPLRTTLANSQSALPHALISSKSPPRHWTSSQMRLHARALLLNFNSLKKLAYPCRVSLAWSMMIIAGGTSHTLPACPLGKLGEKCSCGHVPEPKYVGALSSLSSRFPLASQPSGHSSTHTLMYRASACLLATVIWLGGTQCDFLYAESVIILSPI